MPGASRSLEFTLEPGESIWTESSYKYEPDGVRALVESCGFETRCEWIDDDGALSAGAFRGSDIIDSRCPIVSLSRLHFSSKPTS